MDKDTVKQVIHDFILVQFLPGEEAGSITDQTQLITDGVLDSLGSLRLVAFLEERFGIKIEAHEVDVDHLDTVELISIMVMDKRAVAAG